MLDNTYRLEAVTVFWTVWPKTLCLHFERKVKQLWQMTMTEVKYEYVHLKSKYYSNNRIKKKLTENYRNCPTPSLIFLSDCWLVLRTEIISFTFLMPSLVRSGLELFSVVTYSPQQSLLSVQEPWRCEYLGIWLSLRWGDVNTSEAGLWLSSLGSDIYSSLPTCWAVSA